MLDDLCRGLIVFSGIGSTRDGMNPVQERLAEGNGTQVSRARPRAIEVRLRLPHKEVNVWP